MNRKEAFAKIKELEDRIKALKQFQEILKIMIGDKATPLALRVNVDFFNTESSNPISIPKERLGVYFKPNDQADKEYIFKSIDNRIKQLENEIEELYKD